MTVPELIEFLKPLEYGGATGKPREINFCIGGFILEDAELKVSSADDGLYTAVYEIAQSTTSIGATAPHGCGSSF